MYMNAYEMGPPLNMGVEGNSYMSVAAFYNSNGAMPFPITSCACDPTYEMLWCTTQHVISTVLFFINRDF